MAGAGFDYQRDIPAGFYDEIHRRGAGARYCWHDLKFRAVAARLGSARTVLDVGCGPGTFIGNYAGAREALGVDLAASQIAYANRLYATPHRRFEPIGLESMLDRSETFDRITMIELIEHLERRDAVDLLNAARRLLAPGGALVLTTPNYRSLWPVIEWAVNARSRVSYERQHINKYRRDRLCDDLSEAGFREIAITTIVGFAPFAGIFGVAAARALDFLEGKLRHLGCGHLLLAVARA